MATIACIVVGCEPSGPNGQVSGKVTDISGHIVVGASISVNGDYPITVTNTAGRYILTSLPAADLLIRADITQGSTPYVGSNVAQVNDPGRAKDVNIVVVPANETAAVHAVVYDSQNKRLVGARVYALPAGSGVDTSSMAITDGNGECTIVDLIAGQNYSLLATGQGYQSAPATVTLTAGETRPMNFTLSTASDVLMPPPTNITAAAWTTPHEDTQLPDDSGDSDDSDWNLIIDFEAVKNRLDPHRAAMMRTTRTAPNGNDVEVDLTWNPIAGNDLLGFGVYRGIGSAAVALVDDLRDPMASFYADQDDSLVPGQAYAYQMTSLNTLFPTSPNGESSKSNRVTATPLGQIELYGVSRGPLSFQWTAASGAVEYTVYLYGQEPNLASIAPIWTSAATSATSCNYTGPSLLPLRSYYCFVVGDDGANARTISDIKVFRY